MFGRRPRAAAAAAAAAEAIGSHGESRKVTPLYCRSPPANGRYYRANLEIFSGVCSGALMFWCAPRGLRNDAVMLERAGGRSAAAEAVYTDDV